MAAPLAAPFPSAHSCDVRPGDMVRLVRAEGLPVGCDFQPGHIYGVARVEADSIASDTRLILAKAPQWRLLAWRFERVAAALPADPPPTSPIVERMAQVMRERELETGACDRHDLARAGFTAAQIIEYADEARGLAGAPSQQVAA